MVDGRGCSRYAYNNLTRYFEPAITSSMSQQEVDAVVSSYAPDILKSLEARSMLGKDFSEEAP